MLLVYKSIQWRLNTDVGVWDLPISFTTEFYGGLLVGRGTEAPTAREISTEYGLSQFRVSSANNSGSSYFLGVGV